MAKNKKQLIPKDFLTIDAASEFWDAHDLSDYWDITKPSTVDFRVGEHPRYVVVEAKIARKLALIARKKKVSPETLVNLWLAERLSKVA